TGVVELGGVDDLDETAVDDAGMLAGEHHPYEFLRLGESAGLDDDDVHTPGRSGEPGEIDLQFTRLHRAGQTAVAERDGRVAERARDGQRVDLDGAEVVDDRPDAAASAAVQQMVEERGLAGAQESGEHDDGDLLRTAVVAQRAAPFP